MDDELLWDVGDNRDDTGPIRTTDRDEEDRLSSNRMVTRAWKKYYCPRKRKKTVTCR